MSPLLSNLYLHILDRIWERNNLRQRLGACIVRYADDIVILCRRNKSGKAMVVLRQILERLKLSLNETKTKIVNAFSEKFNFLGFTICCNAPTYALDLDFDFPENLQVVS
ncbi:MAG: hypothetical protein H7Y42_08930 [Chitinophagaceae bacterium]|nr:hypothetical protein [Chitinophagaceae bacterium]